MTTVYIYVLIDPTTKDIRYVGLTRYPSKRLCNHCHKGSTVHFRNWIAKLKDLGTKPTMEVVCIADEQSACTLEREWILAYRMLDAKLLNYTDGGERGYSVSPETIEKLKTSRRARVMKPFTAQHCANLSRAGKGRKCPEGARDNWKKAIAAIVGKPLSEEHRKRVSQGVSKSMTPELREHLSRVHKGKRPYIQNDQSRQRISEGLKRYNAAKRAAANYTS